jgi:hypothetical protein
VTFLKYLAFTESTEVVLGKRRVVERARLGQHLLLSDLRVEIGKAVERGEADAIVSAVRSYLEAACGPIPVLSLPVLVDAAEKIWSMNWLRESFAFMQPDPKPQKVQPVAPYEYPDRYGALWITTLATEYPWSEAEILDLVPERAAYYYQEALIRQAEQKEWEYIIHGLGHDKNGHYKPLPKPSWMGTKPKEQIMRIPKTMLPVGLIIRAGDVA